ncbi:MAG: hypothetical protein WAM90_15720 [Rhodanobacter sp.]
MTDHTRPERFTDLSICRRLRAKVYADPCGHCIHREMAFDKATCPTFGRTFPRCMNTPGLQFEPDHKKLAGE